MIAKALHSSNRDDWETPDAFFQFLDAHFRFTLDAAASANNAKCARYLTDALRVSWGAETVWLNPPYGRGIGAWIRKAADAADAGATVVVLCPARTDAAWWHEHALRAAEVHFIRGRLHFVGAESGAPFPSALLVFRPGTRPGSPAVQWIAPPIALRR